MKVVEKQVKSIILQFNRDAHNEQLKIDQFRISNSIKKKLYWDIYILKKKKNDSQVTFFFKYSFPGIKIRNGNIKVGVIQNVFVHVKEKKKKEI